MSGDGQMSLAEALLDPRLGMNKKLDRLAQVIDWSRLAPLAHALRGAETGRPPYPALAMVKALYLQALYDLSDPGLEEALTDRLSFRRFCGFDLAAATPDETTICRFRAVAAAVLAACFAEVNRQLDAQGLLLKKGTLMDATLVQARLNPPAAKAGLGARHEKEPGADWTKHKGKGFFGYKTHLGTDQGSGLIRRIVVTSAKVYESEPAEALISGDERAVYGDKAYEHGARRARLKARGIKDRIMHRRHKHLAALPHWQQRRNHLIARHRAPVEAAFSAFKRLYGGRRARYLSLAANTARWVAVATVYNLRRACLLGAT